MNIPAQIENALLWANIYNPEAAPAIREQRGRFLTARTRYEGSRISREQFLAEEVAVSRRLRCIRGHR